MELLSWDVTVPGRIAGVGLSIAPGTVTAICGPNGAGKSTLLAAMAGLLPLSKGEVRLAGQSLTRLGARERARVIGFLPQAGSVAWNISVRTLVEMGRLPHRSLPLENARAVDGVLAALDLFALADRPVAQLSGGERARALLARVLAGEPDWVLADEPLAALDLLHQQALLGHFRALASAGQGVVLVLHDLALAMNHADQVVVLDSGRLVAHGAPEEALAEAVIRHTWGVNARWIGDKGQKALILAP